jgi:hypothetical protein
VAVSLLMLLGLVFGYIAWQQWGPLAGIIVGFVFAGGLGWRLLALVPSLLRLAINPRRARKTGHFAEAWEARFGKIDEDPSSQPPPGMFPAWYRAWRKTGISAGDWLDAQMRRGSW